LGTVPGAAALLRFADIVLLPSDHEGTPVSLIEAMAAGLPCLASAVGGIPELFGTGGGLAVENDPGVFAAALESLLDDPQRRLALGARAREVWRADFSTEGMVAAYEGIYRDVGGGWRGRGVEG
jgi:glycosyltransferase involved in cell wall biosynthesis